MRRITYVTPALYLGMLLQLRVLHKQKQSQVLEVKRRYDLGLEKLLRTAEGVAEMQSELEDLKPQLIVKSALAEQMMVTITTDRSEPPTRKVASLPPPLLTVACFTS